MFEGCLLWIARVMFAMCSLYCFSVNMFDPLTISIAVYLNDEALTNIFICQIT